MSHRHSCERCRQQKVRCLRDSEAMQKLSPGQPIPKCLRCVKAATACVYSLRLRTRRLGSTAGSGVTAVGQSLQSAADTYPTPFDSVDEDVSPYQLDIDSFNWDQMAVFSPAMPLAIGASQARGSVDHISLDLDMTTGGGGLPGEAQWWGGVPSPPSLASPKPETCDGEAVPWADSLQGLMSQATSVSAQAVLAIRRLQQPRSAPPTVSSVLVNEAFEGTKTLVRVINSVVAMAPPPNSSSSSIAYSCSTGSNSSDGDDLEAAVARSANGGLVLTTLACHQHLLAFFCAICESIKRFVESVADGKQPPGASVSSPLHRDGTPSTAQFTMVLQLLVHLINRLDRCLFPTRPASPASAFSTASAYGGGGGGAGGLDLDLVLAGQGGDEVPDMTGIPRLAQALVRAMPADHQKLRRTISELQARMESLEAF